jgi:hypothetical protein
LLLYLEGSLKKELMIFGGICMNMRALKMQVLIKQFTGISTVILKLKKQYIEKNSRHL